MESEAVVLARLDSARAAAYLGKSKSWLDKERSHGRGPAFHRIGSKIEYTREQLDAYLKACEVQTEDSRRAAA